VPEPEPAGTRADRVDAGLGVELERLLRRQVEDGQGGPGAVLGIYRDGALIGSAALGRASVEHDVPLAVTTPVEIASLSKQLGAAAVLTLAREGLLELDTDLRNHVPELRMPGITLRHCLQHTSGLPDYLTVGQIVGLPVGRVIGYQAFLADLARLTELHFPPGTDVSYSNTGYVVAAITAERVAGRPFPELVAERVFGPLGMRNSRVRSHVGQVTRGMAFSYAPTPPGGFVRVEMGESDPVGDGRHTVGDGEVLSTIADFAAWHGFLLDGRVLGADIRDEMVRPGRLKDGRTTSYGMGLVHQTVGGVEAFGHSGSMWGYLSQSLTGPRSGTGVAVFANRSDIDIGDLAWRALRTVTDSRRVTGGWYSPEAVRSLQLVLRADGGVDVDVDGDSLRLEPVDETSWLSASADGRLHLDGDTLVLTDGMGRRVRYRRAPEVAAPHRDSVTGTYQGGDRPDARFEVRAAGEGLELVRGSLLPTPLRFVTTVDGVDIYDVEGAVLAVEHTGADVPRITISAGSAVLRRIPRTGRAASADTGRQGGIGSAAEDGVPGADGE
jgi:CubicO group peptidase (beta-lactamase class C family)